MILKIAFKSLIKNYARSVTTIILTALASGVLVFMSAFMDGSHNKMLQNAVEVYSGYIEITNKEYRKNPNFDNLIFNRDEVDRVLETIDGVESFANRFETFVLLSTDKKTISSMIVGIEPQKEEKISMLKKSLIKGEYLSKGNKNRAYIGDELAKRLNVKVGDTISFIGNGVDYSFCADNLIIGGIFKTGLFEFDNSSVFVTLNYFDEVFVSKNMATMIVVLPKNRENAIILSNEIQTKLNSNLISESWKEFMSSLVKAMEMDSISGYITLGIFFVVIFFVILIYNFLLVFSRTREIGLLKAIGTSNSEVFGLLMFEVSLLAFIGVIIGGVISGYLNFYFSIHPIDFSSQAEQFKQYGLMSSDMPTEFNLLHIFRDMILIFILNILSTIYPILKLNSLTPLKALRNVL